MYSSRLHSSSGWIALVLAFAPACAHGDAYRPDAVTTGPDAVTGRQVVRLKPVRLKKTWDGEVTLSLLASREGGSIASVTVRREGESRHHQSCRTLALSAGEERAAKVTGEDVVYDSDLIEGDSIESFTVHVQRDLLQAMAAGPESSISICRTRFRLEELQRRYVADFLAGWTADPDVQAGE